MRFRTFMLVLGIAGLSACGGNDPQSNRGLAGGGSLPGGNRDGGDSTQAGDRFQVDLSVTDTERGLSLVEGFVDGFKIDVQCSGGYTLSATTTPFFILGKQTGCTARLRALTIGGVQYSVKQDFPTQDTGATALFTAENGSQAFVTITAQLPSNIDKAVSLSYRFSEIRRGNDQDVDIQEVKVEIAGDQAPEYDFTAATIKGANLALTFTCRVRMTGNSEAAFCDEKPLRGLLVAIEPLIADLSIEFIDKEFLDKLFTVGGIPLGNTNTIYLPPRTGFNGGFEVQMPLIDFGTTVPGGFAEAFIVALRQSGETGSTLSKVNLNVNTNQ